LRRQEKKEFSSSTPPAVQWEPIATIPPEKEPSKLLRLRTFLKVFPLGAIKPRRKKTPHGLLINPTEVVTADLPVNPDIPGLLKFQRFVLTREMRLAIQE